MEFLKKFFNDDSTIIGLSGFKMLKPKYNESPIKNDFFFNPFQSETIFETKFEKNVLLI